MGKKLQEARTKVETKLYAPLEAFKLLKENAFAKFDETVEVAVKLGVDPRQSDQNVRSVVVLPHGSGKTVRVLVFTKGEKAKEALDSGADFVGAEELVQKIQEGWLDFDVAIATPDVMSLLGKLGKILGPRGLMPNPKTGTVTFDLVKAIKEYKAGKIEFRVDKGANVHAPIGKVSFTENSLIENFNAFIDALNKAKPPVAKGQYIKKVFLSSTMGPGIRLDPKKVLTVSAKA